MSQNGMVGSDPRALIAGAVDCDNSAEVVRSIQTKLTGSLSSAQWNGRSATAFRTRWSNQHSRSLRAAATFLDQVGDELRLQADQQRNTTASDGRRPGGSESLLARLGRYADILDRVSDPLDVYAAFGAGMIARRILRESAIARRFGVKHFSDLPFARHLKNERVHRFMMRHLIDDRRTAKSLTQALKHGEPVTKFGVKVGTKLPWLKAGFKGISKVAGPASIALSVFDAGVGVKNGDWGAVGSSVASGVGTALMMTPVPGAQVVGGALIVGSMVYDNRKAIADAGKKVGGFLGKSAKGLVKKLNPFG